MTFFLLLFLDFDISFVYEDLRIWTYQNKKSNE